LWTVNNKFGKKGDLSRAKAGLCSLSLSYVFLTYSAYLGPSSPPPTGLIVQSTNTRSPSSETAQKVGVY